MKKKIIAAVLAASMLLAMPVNVLAVGKPDEGASLVQLEETNATTQPLGIKESYSYLEKRREYGETQYYVYYAVQIENPNPDYAVDFASLKVTIYDADGSVLKVEEQTLDWVAENDAYWYAGYVAIAADEGVPTRIDYKVSADEWSFHKASTDNQIIRSGELAVTNVSRRGSGYNLRYTGQITNNSQFSCSIVKVMVIYKMKNKEGNEVPMGGDYTYITENLAPGQTTAFELYPSSGFTGYSSYEVVALQD